MKFLVARVIDGVAQDPTEIEARDLAQAEKIAQHRGLGEEVVGEMLGPEATAAILSALGSLMTLDDSAVCPGALQAVRQLRAVDVGQQEQIDSLTRALWVVGTIAVATALITVRLWITR